MPSKGHEAPIGLFADFPSLFATVLRELVTDIEIPDDVVVEFVSERCTENTPKELTADQVTLLKSADVPKAAVVFEVQTDRVERKFGTWPRYVTSVWDRHRVPTVLLVYCSDVKQAEKAAQPIHMGPGNVITPHVVSPAALPPIMNLTEYADRVDLAVFAAVLHSGGPNAEKTLDNLVQLLAKIDEDQAKGYAKTLIEVLPEPAKTHLENLMATATYPYQDAFSRMEERGLERGVAIGEAKMLVRMFAMRGFELTDEQRERILTCKDTAQLDAWADAVETAESIEDVFDQVVN